MKGAALWLVAASGTMLLAGCASALVADEGRETLAMGEERQCFFASEVNGFRNVEDENGKRDDTRVLIDVGTSDTYEFELMHRCPGLRFARAVALDQQGVGRICDGLDVDLVVQEDFGPERCPVTMLRKLPADHPRARPGASD